MKGNKKLLVIAVLLLLISVSFTTYAIYRQSTTAQGTIKAANWVVQVGKALTATSPIDSAEITFTGADLDCSGSTRYGKNNTVAPGDTCTIQFTVDATGSEVDAVIEAEIEAGATLPDGFTAEVTSGTDGVVNLPYATSDMKETVTITVTWEGTLGDSSAKDGTDLAAAGTDLSIPVKITVRQDAAAAPSSGD